MTASITEQVGGYSVSWEDTAIAAKVSRLHVHQDGHVTGMLSITHKNGHGDVRLMPNTQFNFSSEVTRAKHAKQLADKYGHLDCDWVEMFDYLGESVQSAALSGYPAVEVWADAESEAPPLLVDPLIYQGHQNIIFGEKGVAKSTLAYTLAAIMTLPEGGNALSLKVQPEVIRTLVLDWETDQKTFEWYMGRITRGMHFGPVPIFYRRCHLPLAQDIEAIADEIGRIGVKHLIIDSLGAAAGAGGGELKGAESALEFNAALRRLPGITATIIGQTSKGNDTGTKKTIYGSTYFTYYARNIFELYRGKDEGDTQYVALRHTDCNFGRKHPPMAFAITYGDRSSIAIERVSYKLSDFVETASAADVVLLVLKTGPKSNPELKGACPDLSDEAIRQATKRLRDANKITKLPDGKWGITYGGSV
jgi:hypothetical protein